MEEENLRNFEGPKTPRQRSPLDRSRMANRGLVLFLIIIFSLWLFTILYVIVTHDSKQNIKYIEVENKRGVKNDAKVMIDDNIKMFRMFFSAEIPSTTIIIQLMLVILSALAIITCGYFASHVLCKCGVLALFVLICHYLYEVYRKWFFYKPHRSPINVIDNTFTLILKLTYVVIAVMCVMKIGVDHVSDIVKIIIRQFFRFSYLLIFSLFIFALIATVIFSTLYAFKLSLLPNGNFILMILAIIKAIYVSIAIYFYGLSVMSQVVATHEWAENEAEVPSFLLFKCMRNVARHQLGIVAFTATIIGPLLSGIFTWYRLSKIEVIPSTSTPRLEYTSEKLTLFYLVQYTSFYSIIITSINALHFNEATQELFQLFQKNNCKVYSFFWVFYGIQVFALSFVSFFFAIPVGVVILQSTSNIDLNYSTTENLPQWLVLYIVSTTIIFIFTLPVALVMDSIGLTTYFYKLKYEEEKEKVNDPKEQIPAIPTIGWSVP